MLSDGREGRKPITKRGSELLTIKFAHTGFPPKRKKISMMFVNLFCFSPIQKEIYWLFIITTSKNIPSKEERSTPQQLGQKSRAGPKHHYITFLFVFENFICTVYSIKQGGKSWRKGHTSFTVNIFDVLEKCMVLNVASNTINQSKSYCLKKIAT